MSLLRATGARIWAPALVLALAFLVTDSVLRLRAGSNISRVSLSRETTPPVDPASPSGYEARQHRLILSGVDGYHWLMQTEDMLAGGGWRIRSTPRDNAPAGRDVHWAGAVRWWTAGVARIHQQFQRGLPLPLALERVAPWAGTLALALFILAFTPLLAWRFGGVAAALFAIGCVAVYPVYQTAIAGVLDHHGMATMSAIAAVVLLTCGGGGIVRVDGGDARLPDLRSARRWFAAAALAGAVGVWISAVAVAPVLTGIAVAGALVAWTMRGASAGAGWHAAPGLWRLWGFTGAAASTAFFLLEYFPGHMGMRLEVNHPLHALAWAAAGDAIFRLGRWRHGERAPWPWLLFDAALAAAPLAAIAFGGDATFRLNDPFLWALHADYINEFRSLISVFALFGPWQLLQGASVLPLLALPVAAVAWRSAPSGPAGKVSRAVAAAMLAGGIAFAHALGFAMASASSAAPAALHLVAIGFAALAFLLLFRLPLRRALLPVSAHASARLAVAAVPALVMLVLSLLDVRWFGTACALWLAVLVTLAGVRAATASTTTRRASVALLLLLVLAPFPAFTAAVHWRLGYPGTQTDLHQVVARDVARVLRERLGDERGVVLTDPTSTTWLIYFGGVHGLGTLYWENVHGLRAAADIYAAATDAQARSLIERHGVTHIVVFSWSPFVREYARLQRGDRLDPLDPRAAPRDAFMLRLLRGDTDPPWLTPVLYELPPARVFADIDVLILEVGDAPPDRGPAPSADGPR